MDRRAIRRGWRRGVVIGIIVGAAADEPHGPSRTKSTSTWPLARNSSARRSGGAIANSTCKWLVPHRNRLRTQTRSPTETIPCPMEGPIHTIRHHPPFSVTRLTIVLGWCQILLGQPSIHSWGDARLNCGRRTRQTRGTLNEDLRGSPPAGCDGCG